uniref:Uncharacterized protein n=1 Tax=Solanum lycopersicum TaxID=4081 RepID=K4D926_SOLLC
MELFNFIEFLRKKIEETNEHKLYGHTPTKIAYTCP